MAKSLALLIIAIAIAVLSMVVYSRGGPEGNLSEPWPDGGAQTPAWRA